MKIQTSADPPMNQQANQYLMEQRIAELERHNELLRTVTQKAEWNVDYGGQQSCPICGAFDWDGHDVTCEYQAAIDGGALDGEK